MANNGECVDAKLYSETWPQTRHGTGIIGRCPMNIKKALGKKILTAGDLFNRPRAGALALAAANSELKKTRNIEPLYIRRSWAEESREGK